MRLDDSARNCQSKAYAGDLLRPTVELLEDALLVSLWDSGPPIQHLQFHPGPLEREHFRIHKRLRNDRISAEKVGEAHFRSGKRGKPAKTKD